MADPAMVGIFFVNVIFAVIDQIMALADTTRYNKTFCKKIADTVEREKLIIECYVADYTVDQSNKILNNYRSCLENIEEFVEIATRTSAFASFLKGMTPKAKYKELTEDLDQARSQLIAYMVVSGARRNSQSENVRRSHSVIGVRSASNPRPSRPLTRSASVNLPRINAWRRTHGYTNSGEEQHIRTTFENVLSQLIRTRETRSHPKPV